MHSAEQDLDAAFSALRKAMAGIFPELSEVPLAFKWSGLVGMTLDSVPHIGRLDEQTLFSMGYNGAGVAMSSLMGRYLAAFVRGEKPDCRPARRQPPQDDSVLSAARTGRANGGRLVSISGCDRKIAIIFIVQRGE